MKLTALQGILEDYPLNVFVKTPKAFTFNKKQITIDIEKEFTDSVRSYLCALSDLINKRKYYARNEALILLEWLSKLIEATTALRDMVQQCENLSTIFDDEYSWSETLAIHSMIEILNTMITELSILRNQIRGTRWYSRIRDKTFFVIAEKVPHLQHILSTIIAIERGEISSADIVSVIGSGILSSEIH